METRGEATRGRVTVCADPRRAMLTALSGGAGSIGLAAVGLVVLLGGCGDRAEKRAQVVELKRLPLDTATGILTSTGVTFDPAQSVDGKGSLRINTSAPTTVRLYELGDVHVENARLIYQASLRTDNAQGRVYLEMWCHFTGRGEFFSRGLASAPSGTTNWTTQETAFFLQPGENPDNVKLNLVMEGPGTAWIDDIKLLRGTLQ